MEKDTIEELFENLQGTFDQKEPVAGHQERFIQKLTNAKSFEKTPVNKIAWWKPLSVAAGIAVFVGLGIGLVQNNSTVGEQVAKVSPEISKTQFYFANLIQQQVIELQAESAPETQKIIGDTMQQLKNLEDDYSDLEKELLNGGNNKIILSAMITNFQARIDLLNYVLEQIETIKNLKTYNDANYTL